MIRALGLALALVACAPTYYGVARRCPTTTMVVGDLVLAAAAVALAGLHWSADKPIRASIEGGLGVATWVGANYAEVACRTR